MDLDVKVTPSSGRQKMVLDKSGMIKVFLKSPPEDGKANRELIKFLTKVLKPHHITSDDIFILRGATSRKKTIRISTKLSNADLLKALGLEVQHAIF